MTYYSHSTRTCLPADPPMRATQDCTSKLEGLPVEILLDIYSHLDISTIFSISATSKCLQYLFEEHRATILIPILSREFSPFDELLQVYTAKSEDIAGRTIYQPRQVIFQRYPGDYGLVIEAQDLPTLSTYHTEKVSKSTTASRKVLGQSQSVLTERDLDPILEMCLLVRKWERLFPQMRWLQEPENCRSLRIHELARFRRAFYRWWLYGTYFHGELPRPRVGLPEPLVADIRTSQLRYYSTAELLELMDLLETTKDIILHYICPRLIPSLQDVDVTSVVDSPGRRESLAVSWSDQSPLSRILQTYAKLGPAELMHYFDNIYSYPRKRLITEIRLQHPGFTFDRESIQTAIQCVLTERRLWDRTPSFAENSSGGVADFDDERDEERREFGTDASPDGRLPLGLKAIRSQSQYSPRGDDGSYLEEVYARHEMDRGNRTTTVRA